MAEVAAAVEVGEATAYRWVRQDRIDRGELAGTSTVENAELRAARRPSGLITTTNPSAPAGEAH